ncbi:MAG: MFS transporter [Saccharolobus sp.]
MTSPFHYKQFTKFSIFSIFASFTFIQNELTTYWLFILLFHQELALFGLGVIGRPLVRILVAQLSGYISDKYNRAKLFYLTRGIASALLFPLTYAFSIKSVLLIFIIYYVRTIIVEISNDIGYVAYYAVIPDEVRPKAILYVRIISMLTRLASGASWFIIFENIGVYDLFLNGALALIGLVSLKGFNIGGGSRNVKLTTGIELFRRNENVRGIILTYSVTEALTYSINYLLPLLIVTLRGSSQIYSLTQITYYAIFILASFIMTRLKKPTKIMIAYILSGYLVYLALIYNSPYILLISVAAASFGSGIIENFVMATIKRSVSDEFLGSVLALDTFTTSIIEIGLILLGQYLISINVLYYIILGVIGMILVVVAWLSHPKLRETKL